MFHHDEQRTGQSPYIGPISKNVTAKSFTTGAAVYSSPAIAADGTIYVGSTDGKVYAFRSDGSQKWTKPFTTKGPVYSSPAIGPDGTIYIGSQDDNVYALNPDNGNLKWQTPYATTGDVDSSPVINSKSGIIFIGSKDGKLHAIKTADGQQLWAIPVGTSITSSPAISPDGGTIYIGSSDQQLYAVTSSGIIDWKFGTDRYGYYAGGSISSSPAVGTDGTIYIGCDNTYVFAVNPTNGGRKWAYKTGGAIKSSPAISSDGTTIYVGSSDSKLYALNTSDGQEKWISTFIGNKIESSPIVGKDGTIYVGSWDKNVYAIDPATGKEIWHYTTGDMIKSSPAISDKGVLYIGSDDKRLYSISDAAPSATITLTSPIGGEKWAIGSTQNITWTSTGNPGDIKIELLKPGTPSDIISPRILANNKSFSWTINQSEGTDYKVKISLVASPTVIDQSKADFSLIKIDDIPVQLSPSNGGTVTAPVTLAWSPVTIANSYEYEVYGPASTTVPIETNTVTTTSATIQFALIDGNTYSWRIRAIDANNLKHPFSALWTLTTSVSPPTLITPAINAIVDPINVVFTWSALTNATVYDIEMSTNANFKPSALYTTTNTSITKTLAYNTPYSWRVRAKTGNKLGAWSTVGNFTTKSFVFTSGVDAAIANSKYANQLLGIGVINNTGSLQTAVVEQPVNRQSECYIMIKNTGNVEDKFLISSTSAINSKWKVYVYDISGINRTVNVFNGGWTSYSVKPGECVKLLLRFAVASGQKVDESNPQTQSISITAQSWKDINSNAANIASDTVTGTAILTKMSKMN
jgi:outer membrane protein assembly factor BamB